jgi:hypothetical protein
MVAQVTHIWWSLRQEVVSMLSAAWKSVQRFTLVVGHSRAASELTRMGYHEQAKNVMMELKKLKLNK